MSNYSYDDKTQLSEHFNVQEFRCKCGKNHDILVSENLIQMLEKLYIKLNCSKIIVTSGHRCSEYDRRIGNSGTGQHIIGNAADVCCYGQDGKPISSKIVSCTAQDLGFTGIANITKEYIYTHLDVRTSRKYYGDETVNYHTLTDDFYKYYAIQKKGEQMLTHGIDVSKYQGNIEWDKVKASGKVNFAILRAGIDKDKDTKFDEYYSGCEANDIPVGAYWYSKALNETQAKEEAKKFLQAVSGKKFAYPLYFDIEMKSQFALGKAKCTSIAEAFLKELENAGYFAGIYASKSNLESFLTEEIRKRYTVWVAHYGVIQTSYSGQYGMWQYSDSGVMAGIKDNSVDLDKCYIDYPAVIKNAGLNGFTKPESPEKVTEITSEMIENKKFTISFDGHTYSGLLEELS